MISKAIVCFASLFIVYLLLTNYICRTMLLIPMLIVLSGAYFANPEREREDFIGCFLLLIFLLVVSLPVYILALLMTFIFWVIPPNILVMFVICLIVFFALLLIIFRRIFVLRFFYWLYKVFCNHMPNRDFGKPISNGFLIILFIISLLVSYFNGHHIFIENYLLSEQGAIIAINLIVLSFYLAIYIVWRNFFFNDKHDNRQHPT